MKSNVLIKPDLDQMALPQAGEMVAIFVTNAGEFKVRLFPTLVPETHKNFVYHVEAANYNDTIFHRVIEDFMIQGGDIEGLNGRGGYSYKGRDTTIAEEFHPELKHVRGALSMAKTALPATTGSQFFVVQNRSGTHYLDNQHSVFGQVYEGMDVIDAIAAMETDYSDQPLEDVVLQEVKIIKI